MKTLICITIGICFSFFTYGQHVLQDEALQARVHFMNAAKVSYVASAEVYQHEQKIEPDPQIPGDILDSFKTMYQGARKVEWIIKEDRYKVNFVFKGSEMFTYLDRHGGWMKSFTKLSQDDLPQQVVTYLGSKYPHYQLTKYYLKHTPKGQSYTIAVKGETEYVWLEFDEQGQLINSPT